MGVKILLKEWADAVKARDGKCCRCGTEHNLHAHHIKPKRTHPELKLDLANGITLCYRCHKAEHERTRRWYPPKTGRPQRRTLERQIGELEDQLRQAQTEIRSLKQQLGVLRRENARHIPAKDDSVALLPMLLANA